MPELSPEDHPVPSLDPEEQLDGNVQYEDPTPVEVKAGDGDYVEPALIVTAPFLEAPAGEV